MTERRKSEVLRAAWIDGGPRAAVAMVSQYVRWRARGAPLDPSGPKDPAEAWLEAYGDASPKGRDATPGTGFSIVCPVYNTSAELLRQCVESVQSQTHARWELILVDDASTSVETIQALASLVRHDRRLRLLTLNENVGIVGATNTGIEAASYEYTVFMDHDDRLAGNALEWLSACCSVADVIYTDEDKIDLEGAHFGAFFKPAWSPRLLLGINYINHVTCVRTSMLTTVGGLTPGTDGVQDHDLLIRLSEMDPVVAHVPVISYHWRIWPGSFAANARTKLDIEARGIEMVQRAIERRGWDASAGLGNGAPFNYRVLFGEQSPRPFVKIVIPTRNRAKMLRQLVNGVLHRTDGADLHLVIVDNGSDKPKALEYLDELQRDHDNVSVLRIDDAFNFSALANAGAATGPDAPYLLFLNNDVEIIHRQWLQQLVGWMESDPSVVGVGPKLLFPDGAIQHAGVIVGFGGIAGHYAWRQPNQPTLGSLHDQAREIGCLTAACLLVRTSEFGQVGGFDESLPVDFQDVDLSLRLRDRLGGELVCDPTYPLVHLESATRGKGESANGYIVARMRFLWGEALDGEDPYYSPHLSLSKPDLSMRTMASDVSEIDQRMEIRWSGSNENS